MNGLSLAYLGDAYYELRVRLHLLDKGMQNVDHLHKASLNFVSAVAQAKILNHFLDEKIISDDEISIYKKGRNATHVARKNIDPKIYGLATGFEAIIGYNYLNNLSRCDELINLAIKYVERD